MKIYSIPKPYVIGELLNDYAVYGRCCYGVWDTPHEFKIKRYHPLEMNGLFYDEI